MKIRIFNNDGKYRGIDRSVPKWKKSPKDVIDKYLEYVELEFAYDDDDTEHWEQYLELYNYFSKICKSIDLVVVSYNSITHEDFEFLGIDIANDGWESAFAIEHYKYNFLNENKLIQNEDIAKEFLSKNEYNEVGDKHEIYYVYRYKK